MAASLDVVHGDITTLALDAIVNAANPTLLGGGGVDGAIHRAAGPELTVECARLGGCATGEAKITRGYRLPARDEAELLASCYRRSLALAVEHALASIAFPAISCGAYGFPLERAVPIAVNTVRAFERLDALERVVFCCASASVLQAYQTALAR